MTKSTGVGRGHGAHHHGPRAKKPQVAASVATPVAGTTAMPLSSQPVKSKQIKGVGRGHGHHHHGATPKAHHSHKKKVK